VEEVSRPGLRNLKNFVYFNRRFNSTGDPSNGSDSYPGNTYRKRPKDQKLPKDLLRNNPYSRSSKQPAKKGGKGRKRRPKNKDPMGNVMDFFMGPDPYGNNPDDDNYKRYKPDSHIIGTRPKDYDRDEFDSFPSKSYLQKYGPGSTQGGPSSNGTVPFSSSRSARKPHGVRPTTRSISKSSRGRNRSNSPQTLEKKFSRYLYHPPSYFTKKGLKAKKK
jgi:hypothetical protein